MSSSPQLILVIRIIFIWQARKNGQKYLNKNKGPICCRISLGRDRVRAPLAPGKTIICYSKHQHSSLLTADCPHQSHSILISVITTKLSLPPTT